MTKKETREFKTETKKLLDMMIHSVYTHDEIFLREIISNASDALDKLKFRSLTEKNLISSGEVLKIRIELDKKHRKISIIDNGIGMTFAEVNKNIGTIAKSGSLAFFEKLKEKKDSNIELIGQFGIGFYSAFMVADEVTLETLAAGKKQGVRWVSTGDGKYTIEHISKDTRGTTVTIKLKENLESDYLDEYKIKNLVKKYSDYIRYPVEMDFTKSEKPKDKDGKVIEDAEPVTSIETQTLNSMIQIWEKKKSDISDDDYNQFYKNNFHDWTDPIEVIHTKAEGTIEYTALIFIPSKLPFDFYTENYEKGIQLYSKRVFIMEKCKELIPNYLKFVKGLVDSPDFSLNISREILQHNRQLKIIAKNIEKKILSSLTKKLKDERKVYEDFWNEFGIAIKTGLYADFENKEKLQNLVLFNSSYSDKELTTLEEYVSRMPEEQKSIYYVTGKDRASVENLPQIEAIKDKKFEILYLFDKVDEFVMDRMMDYDGKKFVSASRGSLELDENDGDKSEQEEKNKEKKSILDAVKESLGDKVSEVRLSVRLKKSPVCLVSGEGGLSFGMEKVFSEMNKNNSMFKAKKILELNPEHKIFSILEKLHLNSKEKFENYCNILYSQALLIEGIDLDNPADFVNKISDLMIDAEN